MKLFVYLFIPIFLCVAIKYSTAQNKSWETNRSEQFSNSNFDDTFWSNKFAHPGLFNRAYVVTNYNPTTEVFAGRFELPSDTGTFNTYLLAFWDGSGWKIDAPGDFNVQGSESIYCICTVGTDIYIGGNFTTLYSAPISFLARWDGNQWSAVGSGVNGSVRALATDGTNLYVGGSFTEAGSMSANHIAKWDGSNWSLLSEPGGATNGVNATVRAIAFASDGIYVGGDFSIAGGTNANFAAKYNTAGSWESIGIQWTVGSISTIGISTDHIYLGGAFNTVNGWPGNGIIRSDGSGGWQGLGNGSLIGVPKLIVNAAGSVYAMGDFSADAGSAANQIAMWNGNNWSALGNEPFDQGGYDFTLQESDNIYTTHFGFQNSQYLYGNGIYNWDGASWHGIGKGIGDYWTTVYYVKTLAWYNSKLIAGGNFVTAGDKFTGGLVQMENDSWSEIGGSSGTANLSVTKLITFNNKLYASGNFTSFNGVTLNHIGYWDGSHWNAVGSGTDGNVEDILPVGNDIYITGDFFNAGGTSAIGYARWDGNSWHSLGSGGPSSFALVNIGNDIYAGGQFTVINGGMLPVNNLASWDGNTWSDVGGGVRFGNNFTTAVYALAVSNSKLYVGGRFTQAGTIQANNIAIWDGSQWSALGDGLNGDVKAILINGNDVYVGGQFTTAGSNTAFSIAKWDGVSWHPLGLGINQSNNFTSIATVDALLPTSDGLYVGGQFTHAGDKYSNMIALYTDFTTGVKSINNEIPNNFSLSQNYPNPFNPSTTIRFSIPSEQKVSLKIYNLLGENISTLVDERLSAGSYEFKWDAKELTSGVYFYTLVAGDLRETKKLILLK